MAPVVYVLATVTSLACAVLLLRGWSETGRRLLLWSGVCFAGLAVSNGVLFLDLVVWPQVDLYRLRLGTTLIAMCFLLYGMIWESR